MMRIAIVGATGLVGRTMIKLLEERGLGNTDILLLASSKSAGQKVKVGEKDLVLQELKQDSFEGVDYALFSAGGGVSRIFAPIAAEAGAVVIDNSSVWRMDPNVPLVVPEVNAADAHTHQGIIANPNCSTIQMVVALKPLHDAFGLSRVLVSTYQSVSGAGQAGVNQLIDETEGRVPKTRIASQPLAFNTVFHSFVEGGSDTEEEVKMQRETKRIMHLPDLPIAVTCVRVPVLGGHGESIAIEFKETVSAEEATRILASAPGVAVMDDPSKDYYPTTQIADGSDDVYVGRIRKDPSVKNGLLMWVVSDNLRKGAATNAVQILEELIRESE